MATLQETLKEFTGLDVPAEFVDAFEKTRKRRDNQDTDFYFFPNEHIRSFENTGPTYPLRFVALFSGPTGNSHGLFFPTDSEVPICASAAIAGSSFTLWGDCYRKFCEEPENFDWMTRHLLKEEDKNIKLPKPAEAFIAKLAPNLIQPTSTDCLKPFELIHSQLDDSKANFLLLHQAVQSDQLIAKCFSAPESFYSIENWMKLSEKLQEAKRPKEALASLRNIHSLILVYPHNGFPNSKAPEQTEFYRQLFEKMGPLKKFGDQLDKTVISHWEKNIVWWFQRNFNPDE